MLICKTTAPHVENLKNLLKCCFYVLKSVLFVEQEALCRIISTLANKNEELQTFLETVDNTLTGLQEESCKVMSELEAELEQLNSTLEEKGTALRDVIKEAKQRKEAELHKQISEGKSALLSCEELLEFANQTLTITNEEEFLKAAKQIKERVTMAPAFRLTTRPVASENMLQFTVDFSSERAGLQQLHFLPVPRAPEIDVSSCVVRDNTVTVAWQSAGEADSDGEGVGGRIERYELEYRKTNRDSSLRAAGEACWEKIHDIRETHVTISGLKFDSRFVVVRVRARNKAAAGEFSEPVAMETRAYNFGFDAVTAHAELKVQGDSVIWEPQGVKGHDPRLRGKENKSSLRTSSSPTRSAEAPHRHPIKRQEVDQDATDSLESRTQYWVTRRWPAAVTTGSSALSLTGSRSAWAWPIGPVWAALTSWGKVLVRGVSTPANGCKARSLRSTTTKRRCSIGHCLSESESTATTTTVIYRLSMLIDIVSFTPSKQSSANR
ncbi:FSD1-like protein isoform X3 [Anarrhichthys ocellatus]|uniref:FSD1-like protein isoform X3 n=1 Tax=Anarrhichthys ocellatus TaxID=433405 RepID=UPI0012ED9FB6|nr:FSD1-like protein isoform X3 [Anarrhichthys ocellatus]